MLPRQRRPGGGTGGAHRMRMRPWQKPGHGSTGWSTTELDHPGVAATGTAGGPWLVRAAEQARSGHSRAAAQRPPRPALFSQSPLAAGSRVSSTATRRRIPLRVPPRAADRTPAMTVETPARSGRSAATCGPAHPPGAPAHASPSPNPARAAHGPGGVRHLPDRFAARGDWGGVSPSPPCPVRRADPRRAHRSACAPAGPERTAGRTATRQEHGAHAPHRTDNIPAIRSSAP